LQSVLRRRITDGSKSSTKNSTALTKTRHTRPTQVGFRGALGEVGEIRGARASNRAV
jgi:hypothetical protein